MSVWKIDTAHSSVTFTVKHMMFAKVHGVFEKFAGELQLDKDVAKSRVEAQIEVASVNTKEAQRDAHLRSPDFFDADKFPTLAFKSKRVAQKADGTLEVAGDLTLHGVTREVVLATELNPQELKDPFGNTRIAATASTQINRKDFGLGWNAALEAGGVLVGEEVRIVIDAAFIKQG